MAFHSSVHIAFFSIVSEKKNGSRVNTSFEIETLDRVQSKKKNVSRICLIVLSQIDKKHSRIKKNNILNHYKIYTFFFDNDEHDFFFF